MKKKVDVVSTHFRKKVNLKMLRGGSLLGSPARTLAAVDDGVLCEDLVSGQLTPGTNNAAVGQTGPSAYVALGLQGVAVSDLEAVTDRANLEHVVVSDDHDGHGSSLALHILSFVDNLRLFLYEVSLAFVNKTFLERELTSAEVTYNDWPGLGNNLGFRMDDSPGPDGDVSLQL